MTSVLRLMLETIAGIAADLLRSRAQLVAENAMLRQQVINLRRAVKRPRMSLVERLLLVVASRFTREWRNALHIVKPDTLLRWHRDLFRLRWRFRSQSKKRREPRIDRDLIALIRQMASNNRTWGSERIRGELLKLGFRVSKANYPEVRAQRQARRPPWADVAHLSSEPRAADLGLRFSSALRLRFPTRICTVLGSTR